MKLEIPEHLYRKLEEVADEFGVSVETMILAILINAVAKQKICLRG
ncbi:hypothetical protein J7L00_02180 [Candidatus Bathyarchaeota archaeon]|nr:hypothetical protein [Candidatus Bathyarchaeota archaeon]